MSAVIKRLTVRGGQESSAKTSRPKPPIGDTTSILLEKIATSRAQGTRLLASATITKEEAQKLVDVIQLWLEAQKDIHYLWRSAVYILYRLMIQHQVYPQSMIVHNCNWERSDETLIGHGGDSSVFSGSMEGKRVAVKQVRFVKELQKTFLREVVTWKQLKSRYILPLYGIAVDRYDPTAGYIMVSPHMPRTLGEYLDRRKVAALPTPGHYYPGQDRERLMKELAEGIAYLHARKIVHGDLKDTNILMDQEDHIQIADFGLSLIGEDTQGKFSTTKSGRGTPGWIAPESYDNEEARRRSPVDVYAYGLLCYMLITGVAPFSRLSTFAYYDEVVKGDKRRSRPTGAACLGDLLVSDELWDLINRCWRPSPGLRITMAHALTYWGIDSHLIYQPQHGPQTLTKAINSRLAKVDNELSYKTGDLLEVLNCETSRWWVRNSNGMLGFVPKEDLQDTTLVKAKALFHYTAREFEDRIKGLSFKKGEQLDIVLFDRGWWMARNARDEAGFVPANRLKPDWSTCKRVGRPIPMKAIKDYDPDPKWSHHLPLRRGADIKHVQVLNTGNYLIARTSNDGIGLVPTRLLAYEAHDSTGRVY